MIGKRFRVGWEPTLDFREVVAFKSRRLPLQTKAGKGDLFVSVGEEEQNNGREGEQ